jgi:hypothetical protein
MKTPAQQPTDGLEWLRTVRRDLQRDIGQTPQERATYYQSKEKDLHERMLRAPRRAPRAAA